MIIEMARQNVHFAPSIGLRIFSSRSEIDSIDRFVDFDGGKYQGDCSEESYNQSE
jgi:hypothetical protein